MFSTFVCTKFLPTFNYFLEIVYTELHKDHTQVPKTQRVGSNYVPMLASPQLSNPLSPEIIISVQEVGMKRQRNRNM